MRPRARSIPHALALLLALVVGGSVLSGCTSDATTRAPGTPVTTDEAQALAGLLHRDYTAGGANFVEVAPFAEGTVLKLTGEIDFTNSVGRAQAVTTYSDGRPQEERTLFFTTKEIWFGDVPGLPDALKTAGLPAGTTYVRRPLAVTQADGTASLVDVLAQVVLNLSARKADDPEDFLDGSYTWQGQRSVNGQLAAVYRLKSGSTVAVAAKSKQLVEYQTTLPGQNWQLTISLSDHGKRRIDPPSDAQSLDAQAHPQVAAEVGVAVGAG